MTEQNKQFVEWFRAASPYIHAHRNQTFVLALDGETLQQPHFANLIHDLALLNSLGIRVVVVHGARPQIDTHAEERKIESVYHRGLRVTDDSILPSVRQAVGDARLQIESLFTMGLANSPMAGSAIRVAGGNFITARPLGVIDGIDLCHTGAVRHVDSEAICMRLDQGDVVLVSPIGYSPTGELFDLHYREVAISVAAAINASKLIITMEGNGIVDANSDLLPQLSLGQLEALLKHGGYDDAKTDLLVDVLCACEQGVERVHLISRETDGVLLQELFSRDGQGTLISASPVDQMRHATIEDVGGVLELIEPLENQGVLVRRPREKLEIDIEHFTILVRDGTIIGCAAIFNDAQEQTAELACLTIHPEYQGQGLGEALLSEIAHQAEAAGMLQLLVLTTQTAHWFLERGFVAGDIADLPELKQQYYNIQRNSKVFIKHLK